MNNEDFIRKFHIEKTYSFKPPTWLEFLKTKNCFQFAHWSCGDIVIVMSEENNKKGVCHCCNEIEVSVWGHFDLDKKFPYGYFAGINTSEEAYYCALYYAQRLFLSLSPHLDCR